MSADADSYVITPPAAGRHRGGRHRQDVSGAPHLVRRPQLRGAHPRDGPRRARSAVLLRQARRRRSCRTAATVPYPPLTKDMHHEVELVVALKCGGRNIKLDKALDCIYGYGVGIDLTRRDLQIASRDMKRPWEIGKAFDASAPCGPLQPASKIGHPQQGPHRAQGQRQGAPGRRSRADDLERAGSHRQALGNGRARRRRHHHDRHAVGRGRHRRRRQARMRDRGRRQADGDDRPAGEVTRRAT